MSSSAKPPTTEHVFADRDGRLEFVGDFEGLYQTEDDPWGQSASDETPGRDDEMTNYYRYSRNNILDALLGRALHRGLEIGCGHGHLTSLLAYYVPTMVGMDISFHALQQAAQRLKHIEFIRGDICKPDPGWALGQFDIVVWGQILWYVLDDWPAAFENTDKLIAPGGLFVVTQAFLREQRYGRAVIDGFDGALQELIGLTRGRYQLIEAKYDDSFEFIHHDGLLIFRKLLD